MASKRKRVISKKAPKRKAVSRPKPRKPAPRAPKKRKVASKPKKVSRKPAPKPKRVAPKPKKVSRKPPPKRKKATPKPKKVSRKPPPKRKAVAPKRKTPIKRKKAPRKKRKVINPWTRRDGTKAKHPSVLRHLIEDEADFTAFRKHLLKINGGEGRGKAFTDRGYNKMLQFYADLNQVGITGISMTELYTILMSP